MAMHSSASIWLSLRIIPISAHIAEPTRPITMSAVRTGASSRMRLKPTAAPSILTAPKRTRVSWNCSATTMPTNAPATVMTVNERVPMKCNWRNVIGSCCHGRAR